MSYLVLARKWRPRAFPELLGQDSVVRALRFALTEGRVHHAYLFSGIRGVGKTTIARLLAKALNCERGVGADPCGVCAACTEIDGGRFPDLIEVDAASRTKVDDTRELLDNVQYAPTRGRYKVYLIDEVHMLSAHSFNALLKTLEEPPPHVKFILATTDPQKLPVTVLSRCQKFALRRLSDQQIRDHLARVLTAEGLAFDDEGLMLVARAGDGSARDALSLLDQAIAAGHGAVTAAAVREMLGAVAPELVTRIVRALSGADGGGLVAAIDEAYSLGVAPEALLDDVIRAWHEIAIAQLVPGAHGPDETWTVLGAGLAPELVQLFYEIGCLGRRQLAAAPDPGTGVRMTFLRMLAFRPLEGAPPPLRAGTGGERAPAPVRAEAAGPAMAAPGPVAGRPSSSPSMPPAAAPGDSRPGPRAAKAYAADGHASVPGEVRRRVETAGPSHVSAGRRGAALHVVGTAVAATDDDEESAVPGACAALRPGAPETGTAAGSAGPAADTDDVLERLGLTGLMKHLAMNAVLEKSGAQVTVTVDPVAGKLLNKERIDILKDALCAYYKDPVTLSVVVGPVSGTPSDLRREAKEAAWRQAKEALDSDPGIVALKRTFNARINEQSIEPRSEKP